MSVFKDSDKEIGNCRRGRHAHCNAFVLMCEEVSKLHSVVFHNDMKGFDERSRREVWVGFRGRRVVEEGGEAGETLGGVDVGVHRDRIVGEETGVRWEA